MKTLIKNISIASPCQLKWSAMSDTAAGKFCNNCQQSVVDFEGKSKAEILETLKSTNEKICGKFNRQQLASINQSLQQPSRSGMTKIFLSLAVTGAVIASS